MSIARGIGLSKSHNVAQHLLSSVVKGGRRKYFLHCLTFPEYVSSNKMAQFTSVSPPFKSLSRIGVSDIP